MNDITAIMPYINEQTTTHLLRQLFSHESVKIGYVLNPDHKNFQYPQTVILNVDSPVTTETLLRFQNRIDTEFILYFIKHNKFDFSQETFDKFFQTAERTGAGMIYSDYFERKGGRLSPHPLIDYQSGSIRDDFDFGSFVMIRTSAFKHSLLQVKKKFEYAGFYDLRLRISRTFPIHRISEFLYTINEAEELKPEERVFEYVNPKNRQAQLEFEKVATEHLKEIGASCGTEFKTVDINSSNFNAEASIIIPVKNREKTIAQALESALNQKTDFNYNIIIVDNYSSDGTTKIINDFAKVDSRIVHLIPERKDLLIGGCWEVAIQNSKCGRFSVQLDSDDIYQEENTLQKIIDKFRSERCAMVIGTYKLTDFNLNEIPPGIVDHKEWTDDNGPNNALRINGLGAPRAFFTPLLRQIEIPNVGYGEDYFLGITISREYRIGRIYEPIYICRRWADNTDAKVDIFKSNANNYYKDSIRTLEITIRQNKNRNNDNRR